MSIPFTKKHRENLSKAKQGSIPWNKGKKGVQKNKYKGKEMPWIGHDKPHTLEARLKMSETILANPNRYRGEKHWNWKGGIDSDFRKREMMTTRYKNWRLEIFKRDNFTCQSCGVRGGYLEADHIKPGATFPELRYEISNGRTLCRPCHEETFIFFGNKNIK